jgi:hypothetical protein
MTRPQITRATQAPVIPGPVRYRFRGSGMVSGAGPPVLDDLLTPDPFRGFVCRLPGS